MHTTRRSINTMAVSSHVLPCWPQTCLRTHVHAVHVSTLKACMPLRLCVFLSQQLHSCTIHKPSHTPPPTHRCARCAYGPAWPQSCQRSNICVFFAGCTCSLFQPHAVYGQAKAIHSHAHLFAVFLAMFTNNHECVFQDTMATAGHGS